MRERSRNVITIWKRRELLCTFDIQKQAEVRTALKDAGIEYRVAAHSRAAAEGGRRTGSFGEKAEWGVE